MKFIFEVWVLTFTVSILDLDLSNKSIKIAVTLSWR